MSSGSKRKAPSASEQEKQQAPNGSGGGSDAPPPLPGILSADLASSLENPALCDVALVGSDGGRVPAMRCILAARSKVLERMLLGSFSEAAKDEVEISAYHSAVLRAIVHFCCTDELIDANGFVDDDNDIIKVARLMASLCAAADFFELRGLQSKAAGQLDRWTHTYPCFACAILDENVSLRSVHSIVLNTIRGYPYESLLYVDHMSGVAGVTMLSPESLSLVVQDSILGANAPILFEAVKIWSERYESADTDKEEILQVARNCASKIELRLIPPRFTLTIIRKSGLVDVEKMFEVLAKQAQPHPAAFVFGAGSSCVNGIYEKCPNDGNAPGAVQMYRRKGKLDGDDVNFFLYRGMHTGVEGSICSPFNWWISATASNAKELAGTAVDRDFYRTRPQFNRRIATLKKEFFWLPVDYGSEPGPMITFTPTLR